MTASSSGDVFDIKRIRRLVQLMKDHDLAEVDLEQGEQRIRLRRSGEVVYQTPPPQAPLPVAGPEAKVENSAAPAAGSRIDSLYHRSDESVQRNSSRSFGQGRCGSRCQRRSSRIWATAFQS